SVLCRHDQLPVFTAVGVLHSPFSPCSTRNMPSPASHAGSKPRKRKNRNRCPVVAGRSGVGVAGPIGGPHLESVATEGQAAIALGARAGCESTPVELAGEGATGLGGREAEARAAADA